MVADLGVSDGRKGGEPERQGELESPPRLERCNPQCGGGERQEKRGEGGGTWKEGEKEEEEGKGREKRGKLLVIMFRAIFAGTSESSEVKCYEPHGILMPSSPHRDSPKFYYYSTPWSPRVTQPQIKHFPLPEQSCPTPTQATPNPGHLFWADPDNAHSGRPWSPEQRQLCSLSRLFCVSFRGHRGDLGVWGEDEPWRAPGCAVGLISWHLGYFFF